MKIGDLVKWTNPNSMAYGIIVRNYPDDASEWYCGKISVVWMDGVNGLVDRDHEHMELVNESR